MLSISYDSESLQDGAGAQLQRVIGVYSLSQYFRIGYIHNPLAEILVHPADGVNNEEDYFYYKTEINELIDFESSAQTKKIDQSIEIRHLGVKQFFYYLIRYRFSKIHVHLIVLHPYHLLDRFPRILDKFKRKNPNPLSSFSPCIAIHVRQSGPTDEFVLRGEKKTRNLPGDYYIAKLEEIRALLGDQMFYSHRLMIVTDELDVNLKFTSYNGQEILWEGAGYPLEDSSFRVHDGRKSLQIQQLFPHGEIHRGGSPAQAIRTLGGSDFLVMSRSSLSEVACLLSPTCKGIAPPEF
jgi:hypothetical protein